MQHDFTNRLDLLTPFLALSVWAAHFMTLWGVSSVFPEQALARWIAVALTIAALATLYGIARRRPVKTMISIPGLGLALSGVATVFTALPAVIG